MLMENQKTLRRNLEKRNTIQSTDCLEQTLLQKMIEHLKRSFEEISSYPKWVTTQRTELVESNISNNYTSITFNGSKTLNRYTPI